MINNVVNLVVIFGLIFRHIDMRHFDMSRGIKFPINERSRRVHIQKSGKPFWIYRFCSKSPETYIKPNSCRATFSAAGLKLSAFCLSYRSNRFISIVSSFTRILKVITRAPPDFPFPLEVILIRTLRKPLPKSSPW